MIEWHRKIVKQIMENFNIDSYQLAWISFFEGVFLTVVFYEFFVR